MSNDYRSLVTDVKKFIKDSYPLHLEILTTHAFSSASSPPPPIKMEAPPPSYFPSPVRKAVVVTEPPKPPQKWHEVLEKKVLTPSSITGSDVRAQMLAALWKEREKVAPLTALFFEEDERIFLEKVVRALCARGVEAALVDGCVYERENLWDIFLDLDPIKKLVVPYGIHTKPYLGRFFMMQKDLCFLHKIPTVVLAPIRHYDNNPQAKKVLWQMLYER